jgi:hypothetical protein
LQTKLTLLAETRRVRQLELRNATFDLKQQLDGTANVVDPVCRWIWLCLLERDADLHSIKPSELEDLADKTFVAETILNLATLKTKAVEALTAKDWEAIGVFQEARSGLGLLQQELTSCRKKIEELSDRRSKSRPPPGPLHSQDYIRRLRTAAVLTTVGFGVSILGVGLLLETGVPEKSLGVSVFGNLARVSMIAAAVLWIALVRASRRNVAAAARLRVESALNSALNEENERRSSLEAEAEPHKETVGRFLVEHPLLDSLLREGASFPSG